MKNFENYTPNNRNGHCPVCGKDHPTYDDAWKCGIEAGYTLALFRDNFDIVPDEAYRMAYTQVLDITEYLKKLPGYKEEKT
jgi:hypothetical protein